MIRTNDEASPERPISARWNGSAINIYDFDGTLQDASYHETVVYDRSDFPYPIERVQSTAEIVTVEGEEALALKSILLLDRTRKWERDYLNKPLKNSLDANTIKRKQQRKIAPFHILNHTFDNTFLAADDQTGAKFLIFAFPNSHRIVITNKTKATAGDKSIEIHPPAIHSASSEKQLLSLLKVTAMLVDLSRSFGTDKSRMSPLKRRYDIGQNRRMANQNSSLEQSDTIKSSNTAPKPVSQTTNKNSPGSKIAPEDTIILSDVGGLDHVKKTLHEVAASFKHPEVMEKWGAKRPQGVLLYGEPGTGKTMLAQALANEIGAKIWALQSTDIYEKWLGNSEQHIKDIFNRARQIKEPTVIFFDELDSIVGITNEPSSGGSDNTRNAVAGIFKQEMNTLAEENPNLLIVAATNDLEKIDPSLIRSGRFDYKVYIPMPDQDARQEIIVNKLTKAMLNNEEEGFKIFGDSLMVDKLAEQTDNLSGADITEIFRRLSLSRAVNEARSGKQQEPITQLEIEQAITDFRTGG